MTNPSTLAVKDAEVWRQICSQATELADQEPILSARLHSMILGHDSLNGALATILAHRLQSADVSINDLVLLFKQLMSSDADILRASNRDLLAIHQRDPACDHLLTPLLFFKGFHAIQTHRLAHSLWHANRRMLASYIQAQSSLVFGVDIHPAAKIGHGIMLDHATGLVIGETAVVEDNVSIMQSVTLGGTGSTLGNRHPKVRSGVLIGAGAKILGDVEIGTGAKIGAGSVVLRDVAPHVTVVGVPAHKVGRPASEQPSLVMDHCMIRDIQEPD